MRCLHVPLEILEFPRAADARAGDEAALHARDDAARSVQASPRGLVSFLFLDAPRALRDGARLRGGDFALLRRELLAQAVGLAFFVAQRVPIGAPEAAHV